MKSTFFKSLALTAFFSILLIQASAQFRVVGYLPNWNNIVNDANAVDYSKITHMNIAFINPTNAVGDLGPTTGLSTVVQKAHDNNVKILMSMGGAGSPASWTNLLLDANRPAYIAKIVSFASTYGFDGVDIDLEGSAIDANYQKFVTDLRAALPAGMLLTAAVATWEASRFSSTSLSKFDFINIMSYDATGTWAPSNPGQHSPYSMAVNDLTFWGTTKGMPASKMCVGVPFYGYGFNTANTTAYGIGYNAIVAAHTGAENHDTVFVSANETIYYNGIGEIQDKTTLALNNAGGIMIWELTQDATGSKSLLTAIDDIIKSSINNTNPVVSITSPNKTSNAESDTITITADALDPDVSGSIAKVVFYAGTMKIGEDASAPYSVDWSGAGAGTYYVTAKAFDNAHGISTSLVDTVYIVAGSEASFGGPFSIPGKIEAENYDMGGDNVSYHDLDLANSGSAYRAGSVDLEATSDVGGGYNVGWTKPGEWLRYTVDVTANGSYDIQVRVATTLSGKKFHIEMNGVNVSGNISVPNTGGWQNWQTVTIPNIPLTSGSQTMKIAFDFGDFNLNYISYSISSGVTGITGSSTSLSTITAQPNPFSDQTTVSFSLTTGGETKIILYDELGKEISTVADGYFQEGSHDISIQAASMNSGFYFCRIIQKDGVKMLKLIKE
ncbi:MAG: glycosyl hydrolase family 18 protein [Cytophagaceae bacterium]